jgi:hypothetical protein
MSTGQMQAAAEHMITVIIDDSSANAMVAVPRARLCYKTVCLWAPQQNTLMMSANKQRQHPASLGETPLLIQAPLEQGTLLEKLLHPS